MDKRRRILGSASPPRTIARANSLLGLNALPARPGAVAPKTEYALGTGTRTESPGHKTRLPTQPFTRCATRLNRPARRDTVEKRKPRERGVLQTSSDIRVDLPSCRRAANPHPPLRTLCFDPGLSDQKPGVSLRTAIDNRHCLHLSARPPGRNRFTNSLHPLLSRAHSSSPTTRCPFR